MRTRRSLLLGVITPVPWAPFLDCASCTFLFCSLAADPKTQTEPGFNARSQPDIVTASQSLMNTMITHHTTCTSTAPTPRVTFLRYFFQLRLSPLSPGEVWVATLDISAIFLRVAPEKKTQLSKQQARPQLDKREVLSPINQSWQIIWNLKTAGQLTSASHKSIREESFETQKSPRTACVFQTAKC